MDRSIFLRHAVPGLPNGYPGSPAEFQLHQGRGCVGWLLLTIVTSNGYVGRTDVPTPVSTIAGLLPGRRPRRLNCRAIASALWSGAAGSCRSNYTGARYLTKVPDRSRCLADEDRIQFAVERASPSILAAFAIPETNSQSDLTQASVCLLWHSSNPRPWARATSFSRLIKQARIAGLRRTEPIARIARPPTSLQRVLPAKLV